MKQIVYKVYPFIRPPAFPDYNIPPTIYSLLNSIVNFGEEDKTKIKNLANAGRSDIFDFEYPLTTHITKQEFECMILNHFLMRRIGYDTLTAFKIALNVKLNEIMPIYNKMFDMLDGWDLFSDGEIMSESGTSSLNNISSSTNTSDRRYSDTPQQQLTNVQDGKYVTEYNYDTDTGSASSSAAGTNTRTITRSPADKIKVYKEFKENTTSIYTMIFNDLDPLFYGLV